MNRRRLPPDERRAELLEAGAREFAAHPYDAVRMDEVALAAGVSRALLYRYFPTKKDLFAEVYRRAADRLLEASPVEGDRSLAVQVSEGLDAHIDYFVANTHTVLAANRVLAGDPVIQAIIGEELDVLRTRLLDASGLSGPEREVVSAVVMSWLVFVQVICVDWLQDPTYSRETLRDICAGALLGAVASVPGLDPGSFS